MRPNENPDIKSIKIKLAREWFYAYCSIRMPAVYTEERQDLEVLCNTLQSFYENKLLDGAGKPIQRLMINMPPRHGKTLTIVNLSQWIFGHDTKASIIDISYNETLSGRFAKYVRDGMQEVAASPQTLVYSDIFPDAKIKYGDAAYSLWSLEGSHFSFLATSPGGTLTGQGAKYAIIDDLVKNAVEAYNHNTMEIQYNWYTDTFISRLEQDAKQLLIMTRWSTDDLCGRLLAFEKDKWHVIKMRANKKYPNLPESDNDMLAPIILSAAEYIDRKAKTDKMIFDGNYDQEPFDSQDHLYSGFKEYTELPPLEAIEAYCDTADEGGDNLALIVYGKCNGICYVLDVLYTQDSMEITEPQSAEILVRHNCTKAYIESNNGGRAFARNIERIMREKGNSKTQVIWFHQKENKNARIFSNATNVINQIIMPAGWQYRWPRFYEDVTRLGRSGKWTHDDAPDALTGIIEKSLSRPSFNIL